MGKVRRLYKRMLRRIWKQKQGVDQTFDNGVEYARSIGVKVGDNSRIFPCNFGSEPYLISIGNHVTITNGVSFITHDGGVWVLRDEFPDIDYIRPIIIHDNCFIGINAIILPGVTIGPNSIVGAGSVVTKSVSPNSVVAGVPARAIKSLEEYKQIAENCLPTKSLSRGEKREYLLNYFGKTEEEWLKKLQELDTPQ